MLQGTTPVNTGRKPETYTDKKCTVDRKSRHPQKMTAHVSVALKTLALLLFVAVQNNSTEARCSTSTRGIF